MVTPERTIPGMRFVVFLSIALLATLAFADGAAADGAPTHLDGPLTLQKQGSFFVGGDTQTVAPNNDITVNQMYVQYQVPASIDTQPNPRSC